MYLRNEKGAPHGDDKLYMTGVPNGRKSLCEWESFAEQIVGTLNTGASPTVTEVSIPNGDHASDPKIGGFYSTYKATNGDQYYYCSVEGTTGADVTGIYLNIWRNNAWVYAKSQEVVAYPGATGSVAVMDVVVADSAIFRNSKNSQYYSQVMYIVNQTDGWFGVGTAGVLSVAFSNNGITWIGPYDVNAPSAYNCSEGVCIEYGGVILFGTTLYIVAVEGQFSVLIPGMSGSGTMTYMFVSQASDPLTTVAYNGKAELTNSGVFSPDLPGYNLYNAFLNAKISYDPDGTLYLSRAYPYPFDIGGSIPCGSWSPASKCLKGFTTRAIRVQMYSMNLGVPADLGLLYSGTWSLIGDWGWESGYRSIN